MEPEEIRVAYFEWIKEYCNNSTLDINDLPGGVKMALDSLTKIDPLTFNISSESIADLSQSYSNTGDVPMFVKQFLRPYKNIRRI